MPLRKTSCVLFIQRRRQCACKKVKDTRSATAVQRKQTDGQLVLSSFSPCFLLRNEEIPPDRRHRGLVSLSLCCAKEPFAYLHIQRALALSAQMNNLSCRRNKKPKIVPLYLVILQSVKLGSHNHAKHWRRILFPHWVSKSTLSAGRKAARHEEWGCLTKER